MSARSGRARIGALLAAIVVGGGGAGACSPGRGIEASRVLGDITAGHGPSALKRHVPEPSRMAIGYRGAGRERYGDLYVPAGPALAPLLLVPGAARQGKDDPRLVAFAMTLARARFLVLVPDIESVRALKVSAANSEDIVDGVAHLAERTGSRAVGLAAISYAVGPAMLAAARPELADHVGFVIAVGGYYDIEAAVTFFTTGWFRDAGGERRYLRPNEYGKWVFVQSNADRLESPGDRALLDEIAARKLSEPALDDSDLVARLGPEGRAVYDLVANSDPERAPSLFGRLPASIRSEMQALDLRTQDLSRVKARSILIHGRDDAIIPFTQSEALAEALGDRATLYLVDSLAHVDLTITGVSDAVTLWRATYRVLAERDRAAAGSP